MGINRKWLVTRGPCRAAKGNEKQHRSENTNTLQTCCFAILSREKDVGEKGVGVLK